MNDIYIYIYIYKAISLQACPGPEGPRRLRLPDFKTISQKIFQKIFLVLTSVRG